MFYASYWFWIIVVLVLFVILWFFYGGGNYPFVGLAPLSVEVDSTSYTDLLVPPTNPALLPISPSLATPTREEEFCPAVISSSLSGASVSAQPSQSSLLLSSQPLQSSPFPSTPSLLPQQTPAALRPSKSSTTRPTTFPPPCPARTTDIPLTLPSRRIPLPSREKGKHASIGENFTCLVMKEFYGVEFRTVRPAWLQNPESGCSLELDCYNEEVGIAVEYNGEQHYVAENRFNENSSHKFIQQVRRDELKRQLCDQRHVYLIVVPYTVRTNYDDIRNYIWLQLPEGDKRFIAGRLGD